MIFSILLALSGLTLSAVAIYYSVIGLTSIFAAAFWPVVVMGTTLEVSKLVAASWLKAHWSQIPKLMKTYMSIAVIILMFITSMGIFGYLSKAHLDQNIVSGDVISKISIFDEKIKTAKDNIDANRKALKQMDEAVDQVMGRSSDEKGAEKAVQIRRSQQKERARLQAEITAEQKTIAALNEERAPIAAEVRKVEAEVGPIKYIAALIYGNNPDQNILEKAVTWVIMIIVFVFDPLAVLMLLAAQMTWAWRKENAEGDSPPGPIADIVSPEPTVTESSNDPSYEPDDGPLTKEQVEQIQKLAKEELPKGEIVVKDQLFPEAWPFPGYHEADIGKSDLPKEDPVPVETVDSTMPVADIDAWNKMIEAAEAEVAKEKESTLQERLATGETYIDGNGEEVNLLEGYEFPENPVAGDEFRKLSTTEDSREYIFNGDQWVNTETSDSEALLQILAQVEESKKKTYMIKEENQQVIKTTNK
jgi:hypothetical protein